MREYIPKEKIYLLIYWLEQLSKKHKEQKKKNHQEKHAGN